MDRPISHKDAKYSIFLLHNFFRVTLEFQVVVILDQEDAKKSNIAKSFDLLECYPFCSPFNVEYILEDFSEHISAFQNIIKRTRKDFLNIKQSCLSISIKLKKPSSCSTSQNVALSKLRRYYVGMYISRFRIFFKNFCIKVA